ncbi:YsnF/AvaK domain-containing protein [Aureimonas leprariae]|uniref:DUF2382 domain-containing protein n=1 Tax=Plantimonas leprariae TaxID=2615207 RepID=A0A7V7PKD5_9HYPH|nr:YsnF/AvaK domain-containing protein [Aureimonas leprariae]KAB0676183.1 DUF2382 domain-containing protein [Aureimonas leprariae]
MSVDRDGSMSPARPLEAAVGERSDTVIDVVEETARIDKVEHVTGTVRVQLVTDTVEETLRDAVSKRSVSIERVPVDRMIDAVPEPRLENGVTILPVVEERLVVEKRLFLVEEVHIRHETTSENVAIPVTLRQQRVVVERSSDETNPTEEE